jgi:hypothetical protein
MKLAFSALIGRKITSIQRIESGRNSKVYKLLSENSLPYIAKVYYRHGLGERNRLQVEFTSLQFLWKHGVRCIPQPIAKDDDKGYSIYEYIDGAEIEPKEVTETDIDYAAQFLMRLADCKNREGSEKLPMASEACLSIQAMIDVIERRLAKFFSLQNTGPQYNDLYRFLNGDFVSAFEEIWKWCIVKLDQSGIPSASELSFNERTLSPSDFGFHNALRRNTGELVFVDFEYFGWDDPAKMIADFLLHPGMELPSIYKRQFFAEILKHFNQYGKMAKRIECLYSLCALNWCLILLNEFIPENFERRTFAGINLSKSDLLTTQLSKSVHMLQTIRSEYDRFPYRN